MGKFTENSTLEEILRHPKTSSILVKYGIYCPTCPYARFEMAVLKIGDVAKNYGVDINSLLKDLNEAIEKGN